MNTKTRNINVSRRFSLRFAPALIIATLIAFCPLWMRADTIALSFAGGTTINNSSEITVGWAFTLSSPVLVTALGIWDSHGGAGLNDSHLVTLWTSTGTQEAQTTIPSGTSAPITDGFRYESITPVVLPAGDYTIGADFPFGDNDQSAIVASTITTASGVTYDASRSTVGNAFPSGDLDNDSNSYFGPNFQFIEAVPEASTWFIPALAAAVIILQFFRRRLVT